MRVGNMLIHAVKNGKDVKTNKKPGLLENKFSLLILSNKGKEVHKKDGKLSTDKSKKIDEKKSTKDKEKRKSSHFQPGLLMALSNFHAKHEGIDRKEDLKHHQPFKSAKNSNHEKSSKNISGVFEGKSFKRTSEHTNGKDEKSKDIGNTKVKMPINNSRKVEAKGFKIETKNTVKNCNGISSHYDKDKKDFQNKSGKHFENIDEKIGNKKSDQFVGKSPKEKTLHVESKKMADVEKRKNVQFKDDNINKDVNVKKMEEPPSNIKKDFHQKKVDKSNDSLKKSNVRNKVLDHSGKLKKSFTNLKKESSLNSQNISLNNSKAAFKVENTSVLSDVNSKRTRTSENMKEERSKERFDNVQVKITKGQNVSKHDEIKAVRNVKTFDDPSAKLKKDLNVYKDLPQVNRGIQSQHSFKSRLQSISESQEQTKLREVSTRISQVVTRALENQKPPLKIEIHLDPPQLGKITINVVEKNGKTSLIIDVEKNKSFELMKSAVPIMTNQLSNLNFNLVNIQLNGQQLFGGNQEKKQSANQQNSENKEENGKKFSDEFNNVFEKEV